MRLELLLKDVLFILINTPILYVVGKMNFIKYKNKHLEAFFMPDVLKGGISLKSYQ